MGKSIQADLVESILGAIYLDKGYKSCHHFFEKKILESFINLEGIKKKIESQKNNYKGKILEWSPKKSKIFAGTILVPMKILQKINPT